MLPLVLVLASLLLVLIAVLCSKLLWGPFMLGWRVHGTFPGPRTLPITGNAHKFWGDGYESFKNFVKFHADFGPVVRLWFGNSLVVLLSNPDDVQQILGNHKIKNRDSNCTDALIPFFGNGLFSNRDEGWRKHRKIVTPTMHIKVLESYVEVFGQKAQVLVKRLEEVADGTPFDPYHYFCLCTLDAICETAIGGRVDTQQEGHSDFESGMERAGAIIHNRVLHPWLQWDWLFKWSKEGKEAKQIIQKIKDFSDNVISEKLADYRAGVRRPGIITASGKKVTSFLDMLVEASESQESPMTHQEIQAEVTTLAGAGYETTANTMIMVLFLIAIHPEVEEQLYEEQMEVFGDDNRLATVDDINRLPVMDRVLKETMRMFPSVSLFPREIDEDIKLPSGYTLPKGCFAWVVAYVVHRNPEQFPEPDKFLPDRWLKEPACHPYAYIPFSAGPRNCVGQKYALMEMKAMLCPILRRFKVNTTNSVKTMSENLQITITLNMNPNCYSTMCLEKRT